MVLNTIRAEQVFPSAPLAARRATGFIDESLGKGLAQRFMDEADDRFGRVFQSPDFKKFFHPCSHKTRKRWLINKRQVERVIRKHSAYLFDCGTNAKPGLISCHWSSAMSKVSGFDEEVMVCHNLRTRFRDPLASDEFAKFGGFEISKHAIARLLQRVPEARALLSDWSYEWVMEAIRPTLFWGGFWVERLYSRLMKLKDVMNLHIDISPIIPSPYGLFLCKFDATCDTPLRVRTFVGNHQLGPEQLEARDQMLAVASGLEAQPLPLSPWTIFGENYSLASWMLALRLRDQREQIEQHLLGKNEKIDIELLRQLDIFHVECGGKEVKVPESKLWGDPNVLLAHLSERFG